MKFWRRPKDENRDHKNFLQHLAGNRQLRFDAFNVEDGLGKFDSAVESESNQWLTIRKPKGRIPFNANLLTAGQVKFSNQQISASVRRNLISSVGSSGSINVYDAVYGMLENKRCANKASSHFHRPKILQEHLKEVEGTSGQTNSYGYETEVGSSKYKVKWNELRGWLYGFLDESQITDPIVESIIKEHKDVLQTATNSLNPTTSILAALDVASSFHIHKMMAEERPVSSAGLSKAEKDEMVEDIKEKVKNDVIEDELNNSNATNRVQAGLEPLPEDISFEDFVNDSVDNQEPLRQAKLNRAEECGARIEEGFETTDWTPSVDASNVSLDSAYDKESQMLGNTGHRLIRNSWRLPLLGDPKVFKRNPITSAELITLVDISGSMGQIGGTDSGIFPVEVAADVVTAIKKRFPDSKAYGFTNPMNREGKALRDLEYETYDEDGAWVNFYLQRSLYEECDKDYALFVKKGTEIRDNNVRYDGYFISSRLATENEFARQTDLRELYEKERLENLSHKGSAGLYPIEVGKFPYHMAGSTPLCGAMKGIEDLFQLHNARILIITDGDGNSCHSGNADDCIRARADIWMSRGVRFGVLKISDRTIGTPYALPADLSIEIRKYSKANSGHINQVFNFLKG